MHNTSIAIRSPRNASQAQARRTTEADMHAPNARSEPVTAIDIALDLGSCRVPSRIRGTC